MFVEIISKSLIAAELHLSQLAIVPEVEVGGAHKRDVDAIVAVVTTTVQACPRASFFRISSERTRERHEEGYICKRQS